MGKVIIISKEGGIFTVDDPSQPGSPPVGRARTMASAIGEWLTNNQSQIGISIGVDESAMPAEKRRRARELRKR